MSSNGRNQARPHVSDDEDLVGVKALKIQATVRHPIVSAYEFEFLKEEAAFLDFLKPCTLYMIIQRPLMVINDLVGDNGIIRFKIDDDTPSAPLICEIDPVVAGFVDDKAGPFELELQFFRSRDRDDLPFDELAGFKIYDHDKTFKAWVTAERFLFHCIKGSRGFRLAGEMRPYMDYTVHYIGKAFDQAVWERLTGHEKMQKVLTLEHSKNVRSLGPAFEISLMLLAIVGIDELAAFPYMGFPKWDDPIVHKVSTHEEFERFSKSWVKMPSAEMTSEIEAMLIHKLKPAYNKKLFNNYPNISRGARSLGYSECDLLIDMMPAALRTAHFTFNPILPPHIDVPDAE